MNNELWNILLIEDDEDDYTLTLDMLETMRAKGRPYRLQWASTFGEGLQQACSNRYDVALVDYDLGALNGVDLIRAAVEAGSLMAFVLLTGQGNFQVDMQAMQAGSDDYLNKMDLNATLLERSIRYAVSHKRSTLSLAQANTRLVASEERFQLASRAVVGMMYDWDLLTNTIVRTEGTQEMIGIEADALGNSSEDWTLRIHPDDVEYVQSALWQVMNGEDEKYELEYRVGHTDGHWVHVLDRGYIVRSSGQAVRAVGTTHDISRQKQLEADLRRSDERFRLALRNSPVTVATIDRDLKYTWLYNPVLDTGDDLIGQGDEAFLPPDAVETLATIKRWVLENEQGLSKEVILNTHQGERIFILALEPLRDLTGAVIGMTAASLDITEQRAMERQQLLSTWQMEAQRHLLDQREMERQQIARDLHDGPIQEVVGLLFSVQDARGLSTQPEVNIVLDEIQEALQKLAANLRGVCNELRPPLLVRFGLERAIRAHAEDYANRHSKVTFNLDLSASLPPLNESLKLALYRIFQESLNNVSRHALASRVTVRLRLVRGRVQLEVQDNGQGFRNTSDWVELARNGHLGLVGMRERAEAIGGRLEVFSRPGKGTRIRVTAPVG